MEQKYIIDPYKFGISIATVIVCILLTIVAVIPVGDMRGLIFLGPVFPFLYVAYLYCGVVTITPDAVTLRRLNSVVKDFSWDRVAELGVVGTKVFNNNDRNKTGNMYIYFSPVTLSEDERFEMALKWPPKDQIYLLFTKERMDRIRPLWNNDVAVYNTGKQTKF